MKSPTSTFLRIVFSFIWAGLILGISFLEAPLKFTAPGITLELGLGIGQIVFQAMSKVEMILFLGIVLSYGRTIKKIVRPLPLIMAFIFLIQYFIFLPQLDYRATEILAGASLPESHLHIVYIVLEVIKLVTLLIFGWINLKSLNHERH